MNRDLHSLHELIRGHRLRFGAALGALAAAALLGNLVPLVCGAVIDGVAPATGAAHATHADRLASLAAPFTHRPWLAALAIVGITAASGVFAWLRGRWSAEASEHVVRDLRDRLHDHVQRLPCRHLETADSGDIVQRCSSDVETVRLFLSTQVVEIGRACLTLVLAVPVMAWISPRMALVSLALFPPVLVYSLVFFRRVKARFLAADEAEAAMTTVLQENLTGIRVVHAFSREAHECARFDARSARFRDLQAKVIDLMGTYWATSDLLCGIQIALPLFIGAAWVARGELSVGALYSFVSWAALLLWPFRQMGRTLTDTGKAIVSLRRIAEILDVREEADPAQPASMPERWAGRLEIRGVRFAHASGAVALDGLDLDVAPGQVVALVGPPGCGKSTLVSLLLRLHDPDTGTIRIDGIDTTTLPRRAVRSLVATVLQEPFLYSRTLDHNIRLGRLHSTRGEVEDAARAACIHDAIAAFPDGYETLVGERGVTLSGGQRQRVAIARAVLEDAPILVLDDALSAVDTRTEARIREALAARRGRRTSLVIAHRLTTTRQADLVAVLGAGRIVQLGTHEQLAAVDGPYRRLWDIQSEIEAGLREETAAQRVAGGSA